MISELAIIENGTTMGEDCSIEACAIIKRGTRLGEHVRVDHHVVVGGLPQDLHFNPTTNSGVRIGKNTVLREGVTVSRASQIGEHTIIGEDCYLMSNSHVGHDAVLGDHVILTNGVLLAGFVNVGDFCVLGGGAVFHQFVRVGEGAIVSGGSRIGHDVPPFALASDVNRVRGLNIVGMKRRNFTSEEISDVRACYKRVYFAPGDPAKKAETALAENFAKTDRGRQFLMFFQSTSRGFVRSVNER